MLQTDEFRGKAWKKLTQVARTQDTITYSDLKVAIGWPGTYQSIGRLLDKLYYDHCVPNDFPDISSLVVRKDTEHPGIGFYKESGGKEDIALWQRQLARARKFDWPASLPPRGFRKP